MSAVAGFTVLLCEGGAAGGSMSGEELRGQEKQSMMKDSHISSIDLKGDSNFVFADSLGAFSFKSDAASRKTK